MFTVHYCANLACAQQELLAQLKQAPNTNPFEKETILVQSKGMAQWLQLQIAEQEGVAANFDFLFPSDFLWQQYRLLFPTLPKINVFDPSVIVWHLMDLIPQLLEQPIFTPLKNYLKHTQDQIKRFQLSTKIAELFDQYLVYRPEWLVEWEKGQTDQTFQQIKNAKGAEKAQEILADIQWQAALWAILVKEMRNRSSEDEFLASHRAYIQQHYMAKLANLSKEERNRLPKRVFIFGISSIPQSELAVLKKLSEHCEIHLFFISPSQYYWGDVIEQKTLDKIALKNKSAFAETAESNSLLATWGKQGRDFYTLLVENEDQSDEHSDIVNSSSTLLNAVKQSISELSDTFFFDKQDNSIQLHACHSQLREVEVLHNQLLSLFEHNPNLLPKDIIVMSPDIDKYAPYINAVFSRFNWEDNRYIPYGLSDQKETEIDPIINSFLQLLNMKESNFSAEQLLELFDVVAIREKFTISASEIIALRHYIQQSGIRMGIKTEETHWKNYNSWQNGLERLLLGNSLKAENGIWQETVALDESYGLNADLIGKLSSFIEYLEKWQTCIQNAYTILDWEKYISDLLDKLYLADESNFASLLKIKQAFSNIAEKINQSQKEIAIDITVLQTLFETHFNQQRNGHHFLSGKVNFCTLLPMRAIPFKVVCLLGMNEADFPRKHTANSFDLMQYAPKKGDRARRDDDRYLFLEALLAAQDVFYISYIGQSLKNNQEELPSILVAQLMDYLAKNEIDWKNNLLIKHPMTAYSPNNFNTKNPSYAKEWADIYQHNLPQQDFLDKITSASLTNEVELDDLITYLQDPIKYYFNRQLGIYFSQQEAQIEENEVFQLSKLENYHFFDKLLLLEEAEIDAFFQQEKLKGLLPAQYFSTVVKQKLETDIAAMRQAVQKYQHIESDLQAVKIELNIEGQLVKLVGEISHKFGQDFIFWRVGALRDKDLIKIWLYHLILALDETNKHSISLYYKNNEKVNLLQFKTISAEEAKAQLVIYLRDYQHSAYQLRFALYSNLEAYFKKLDNENIEKMTQENLTACANADYNNEYIARLLQQSAQLNYTEIAARTAEWFKLMLDNKITSELKNS